MSTGKRPRPRPKQRVASNEDTTTNGTVPGIEKPQPLVEEDSFIIKRNLSTEQMERKQRRLKAAELERQASGDFLASDDDDDGEDGAPKGRRGMKSQSSGKYAYVPKTKPLPTWTMDFKPSKGHSSTSLSPEQTAGPSQEKKRLRRRVSRSRSRSRSLTPPPEIDRSDLEKARMTIRKNLGLDKQTARDDDDSLANVSFDAGELHPDLRAIVESARQRTPSGSQDTLPDDQQDSVIPIEIHWRTKPNDLYAVQVPDGQIRFQLARTKTFHDVFATLSALVRVPASELILTYSTTRVFQGATPKSLNMWSKSVIFASSKDTHDYLRANPIQPLQNEAENITAPDNQEEASAAEEEEEEVIRLKARCPSKELNLKVKKTTTCGEIVAAFLKKSALVPQTKAKPPKVVLDGEKQDDNTTIEDMDLEDGDMVEISGV